MYLKELPDIRAIKKFYSNNWENTEIVLGKDGILGGDDLNFQIHQGKLYYRKEGDWICRNNKEESIIQESGRKFWIFDEKLYLFKENCLYKKDYVNKRPKELILDTISEKGNIEVDNEWVYYLEKGTKQLNGYNIQTKETKKFDITSKYTPDFWIIGDNGVMVLANKIQLFHLNDTTNKEIKMNTPMNLYHVAKFNDNIYLCITGFTDGNPSNKRNIGNDGVYRIDFEKMELVKISDDTYEWIFATSDKLYGVKQKLWGLYDTIEEIECQAVK